MISPEQVETVRQATDIVEVASGYLSLKPSGKNWLALCPFHQEKTPSFNVNPERQIFKCFGCQEGGDVFHLVMALESITFPEAVRMLADRAGIRLTEAAGGVERQLDRERVAEALAFAAGLYERVLFREPRLGAAGRAYLQARGLAVELARDWRLGYAPQQRTFLVDRARQAGFSLGVLEAAGLCYPARDGMAPADRFTHRLMFPILNTRDQVAGFGGRALGGEQKAKYVNSAEGVLFQKSRLLYGLDRVNRARRRQPDLRRAPVYVGEGYLDVIALHAAGLETAVAPLGTALTADHVRRLRPLGTKVVLVFDGDAAGSEATRRAIAELVKQDVTVGVVRLDPGQDPFSLFAGAGAAAVREVVARPLPAYEHLLRHALRMHGDSVEGRAAAAGDLARILGQTPNPVKEDGYIRQAAFDLRADERALRRWWAQAAAAPDRGPVTVSSPAAGARVTREARAEMDLALALLGDPSLAREASQAAPLRHIGDARVRNIVGALYDLCEEPDEVTGGRVLARLQDDPEALRLATELIAQVDQRLEMRAAGRTERDRDPFRDLLDGYLLHRTRAVTLARRRALRDQLRQRPADPERLLSEIVDLDRRRAGAPAARAGPLSSGREGEAMLEPD